jgi:hypothetical protein
MPSTELATRSASIPDKLTYARELAQSGLLPAAFRKQPANVLYAMEYGEMLGLAPMAALTGIHVIEGKPTASSGLMSALVRNAGHQLRVSGDDTKAVVEITRADDPEFTFRSEWTVQRARQAGLLGKDVWKKYPAAMLKARAITECARDACEEALLGMHYTPEELGAEVDGEGVPIQAVVERVDQSVIDVPVPGTEDDPASQMEWDWTAAIKGAEDQGDLQLFNELWTKARGDKTQPPPDPALLERITAAGKRVKETNRQKQMNHLFALLAEGGISSSDEDKPRRLKAAQGLLARDSLATYADLTDAEIAEFIETLTGMKKVGTLAQRLIDFGGPPVTALKIIVEELLDAHNVEAAICLMEKVTARPDVEAEVADLLPESDKETLGIREGQSVHLLDLAEKVSLYTEKHKVGPRVVEPVAA